LEPSNKGVPKDGDQNPTAIREMPIYAVAEEKFGLAFGRHA